MTEPVVASGVASFAWLLLALPAFGAAVLLVSGRRADKWGHLLGSATLLASFGYALALFFSTLGVSNPEERVQNLHLFNWIDVNALTVAFGLRIDPLSLTFVLLITGVGSLIHIYSIGYMAHEEGRRKFFAYLNLFVSAMLLLVLGNGFVTLYFGWEGVGLASYLLIGWYQYKPEAASAAKKAFLMNRVGDLGLAIAIFLMFNRLGTTQYTEVFSRVSEFSSAEVLAITLLLLLGACGKSGQFPLQAWLPDAMAGPTPVSALIHAATMVTAGVYLIARSNPLYNLSEDGRLVVMIIGAVTLLIGCIIGCAYDDFKKVLAYSTVSQIGYMILAVGLGPIGYALGIMHLLTHGFFKAGLFLGAGSVMHGMNDEGNIRRMGGLYKFLPITFVTWTLGYLALIGIPPFAGYFSKDAIIAAAFTGEGWRPYVFGGVALLGAALTAFYMTRLLILVFLGKPRWKELKSEDGREYHPHESPLTMTIPMIILAVGSIGGGWFLSSGGRLAGWLEPSLGELTEEHGVISHGMVGILTVVLALLGAGLAFLLFGRRKQPVERPARVAWPVRAARADLYGNALNEALFARPGTWLTRALVFLDLKGVDGLVNGTAALLGGSSGRLRRLQTGFVRSYALSMLLGSIFVLGALLVVRFS
ncbi:NADH-quinone oxidoreductase subunit L [Lentzea sp. BCCO 10_0798]|uniref:NADH-quinone oxidoreductase subunit L n=1 Tax=Lentzea kristufekii TaxID=3095430 RepID=A0ABU4U3T5_9PSEU|nr:NADH-quinone oxidoreductase subunit L [Lentzea sp. BCCO 10_0798]MDX8055235.1 NADH-quinone oxidoreductase subunit L [Lentzea sp. BCCO 10_0798]